MKISELIKALKAAEKTNGDIDVRLWGHRGLVDPNPKLVKELNPSYTFSAEAEILKQQALTAMEAVNVRSGPEYRETKLIVDGLTQSPYIVLL